VLAGFSLFPQTRQQNRGALRKRGVAAPRESAFKRNSETFFLKKTAKMGTSETPIGSWERQMRKAQN
jgi:hypothetical protein